MRHDLGSFVLTVLLTAFIVDGLAQARDSMPICEKLDRGLVVRPTEDGCVYVGWRLLNNDPEGVGFNVYRRTGTAAAQKLNREPIQQSTNFVDSTVTPGTQATYLVRTVTNGREGSPSEEASIDPRDKVSPYICIKLDGDHTFQKVGIADLNGDGRYDFVIKQPNANIDPYVKYWKASPDTYKIEAYLHNGKFLWRHDLGWAIERGIWYSPYVVYDLNGDGKAEVAVKTGVGDPRDADGRVQTGPEYLTILDGMTGQPITQIVWPSRELFQGTNRTYNYASRNQLGVAYLDGKTPSLIVERGTYNVIVVFAYRLRDTRLEEVWRWDNRQEPRIYQGQGAHWMHAADVDGDGRQ